MTGLSSTIIRKKSDLRQNYGFIGIYRDLYFEIMRKNPLKTIKIRLVSYEKKNTIT